MNPHGEAIASSDVGRQTLVLGSYGGGDSLSLWNVVCALRYPLSFASERNNDAAAGVVLASDFRDSVLAEARAALQRLTDDQREIYRLPSQLPERPVDFSFSLVVTSGPRSPTLNLFAQGWLFSDELARDPSRQGISRYPLCGVFSPIGLHTVAADDDASEPAWIGVDRLLPADQHCHLVYECVEIDGATLDLSGWNVGSDMARFVLDEAAAQASGLFVCFDVDRMRCELSLIVLDPLARAQSSPILSDDQAASLLSFDALLQELPACGVPLSLPSQILTTRQ